MTLPSRQRRRQETAGEVQKITLDLAVQNGLENITTEQISVASGVSTRTLFNYNANKEAAAIGQPPGFSEEDKDILRQGSVSMATDIKRLLDRHIQVLAQQEDILAPYQESGQVRSVQSIIGIQGGTTAFIVVGLPDWAERDWSQQSFMGPINAQLSVDSGGASLRDTPKQPKHPWRRKRTYLCCNWSKCRRNDRSG